MKFRVGRRYTLTMSDGTQWWGDCPKWGAEPVPPGASLTVEPIKGPVGDCRNCGMRHAQGVPPFEV